MNIPKKILLAFILGFPRGSDGKTSACNARSPGSIPKLVRSLKGMALHSRILAWRILWTRSLVGYSPWDTVHEVTKK